GVWPKVADAMSKARAYTHAMEGSVHGRRLARPRDGFLGSWTHGVLTTHGLRGPCGADNRDWVTCAGTDCVDVARDGAPCGSLSAAPGIRPASVCGVCGGWVRSGTDDTLERGPATRFLRRRAIRHGPCWRWTGRALPGRKNAVVVLAG